MSTMICFVLFVENDACFVDFDSCMRGNDVPCSCFDEF